MSIPSDNYLWAESAAPGDVSDPAAKRAGGYQDTDIYPHEEHNYQMRAIGRWIDNLRSGGGVYASYAEFLAEAAVGDVGIINSFDPETTDLALDILHSNVGNEDVVTSDGEYWFVRAANAFESRNLDNVVTVYQTYTPTLAITTGKKIVSNGSKVAITYDDKVELFDRDTGVSEWTYTYDGSSVSDVAIDSDYVHIVGNDIVADSYEALNIATGLKAYGLSSGSTGQCVTTNGLKAYFGINSAVTGGDLSANTNYVIVDIPTLTFIEDAGTFGSVPLNIHVDESWAYIQISTGTAVLPPNLYSVQALLNLSGPVRDSDSEYLYIEGTDHLFVVPKAAARFAQNDALAVTDGVLDPGLSITSAAVAGDTIAVCNGSGVYVYKGLQADKPRRWRRADPSTERYLPYRKLAYPLE